MEYAIPLLNSSLPEWGGGSLLLNKNLSRPWPKHGLMWVLEQGKEYIDISSTPVHLPKERGLKQVDLSS